MDDVDWLINHMSHLFPKPESPKEIEAIGRCKFAIRRLLQQDELLASRISGAEHHLKAAAEYLAEKPD